MNGYQHEALILHILATVPATRPAGFRARELSALVEQTADIDLSWTNRAAEDLHERGALVRTYDDGHWCYGPLTAARP